MNAEHEQELRDLLRRLTFNKRYSYDPQERFVVLKRWGTVRIEAFSNFDGALNFARGYISGPHESPACAFVVDTDPEFAIAHVVSYADSSSTVDLRAEIKDLYSGFLDGDKYSDNMIAQRTADRLVAEKQAAEHEKGSALLVAMILGGILLAYILFN